jgi:hypothetical protein
LTRLERRGIGPGEAGPLDDAADQRKTVRVQPGGGKAEDNVPRCKVGAGQQTLAFCRADGKAGDVVIAAPVKTRHFGRLAADQRCPSDSAALGDTLDHIARDRHVESGGGEIIEKEERLATLRDEVVDAHGDEVNADRLVPTAVDGDLQLGADAVRGGDEDRVAKAGRRKVEEGTEAAKPAHDAGPIGARGGGLDPLHQAVARVDIDPGIAIGQALALVAHCR